MHTAHQKLSFDYDSQCVNGVGENQIASDHRDLGIGRTLMVW